MERVALVVYDSRFGDTWKVAEALSRGLRSVPGVGAHAVHASHVGPGEVDRSALIVVGGPTRYLSASHAIKGLFERIGGYDLAGKFGFALDTEAQRPLTGSASRFIEESMRRLNLRLVTPHRSAYTVFANESASGHIGVPSSPLELEAGTEASFAGFGVELGREFLVECQRAPAGTSGLAES